MTVGDRRFPFVLARMWHASAGEHRSGGRRLSVLGTNTTAMKRPVRHALTRAKLRGSLGLSVYWRIVRLCPWRDSNPQSADGASLRGWCVCQFSHRGLEYRPLRVASADQAAGTPVLWLPSVPIHCGRLSWAYWTQGSRSTAPELPYADPRVLDPRRLLPSKVLQRVSNLALVILMTIILKFETNLGGSSRPAELFQCFRFRLLSVTSGTGLPNTFLVLGAIRASATGSDSGVWARSDYGNLTRGSGCVTLVGVSSPTAVEGLSSGWSFRRWLSQSYVARMFACRCRAAAFVSCARSISACVSSTSESAFRRSASASITI